MKSRPDDLTGFRRRNPYADEGGAHPQQPRRRPQPPPRPGSPSPSGDHSSDLDLRRLVRPALGFHLNDGSVSCVLMCFWLFSLIKSVMSVRDAVCCGGALTFVAGMCSITRPQHRVFARSPVGGRSSCFHVVGCSPCLHPASSPSTSAHRGCCPGQACSTSPGRTFQRN